MAVKVQLETTNPPLIARGGLLIQEGFPLSSIFGLQLQLSLHSGSSDPPIGRRNSYIHIGGSLARTVVMSGEVWWELTKT